ALEAARRLSQLTDATGNPVFGMGITSGSVPVSGSALLSMFMSFGGGIVDGAGAVRVDTSENLAALTYLRTLYEENLNPPAALLKDLRNLFAIGRLGMYFDQFWGIGGAFGINSAIRLQTAVRGPLGTATAGAASTLEAHLLMVSADSPHKELAGEFIRFATARDQLATYFVATPFLPPYASAAEDSVFLNDALAGSVSDAQDSIRAVPAHPEMENVYLSLAEAAQRVTVGGEEPSAVLTDLAAAVESLLAR
ncbi:MAG: extracellular solute-binding protein, partial [Spirochaetales bacterium]|nr:extracellular solute-binding protein [Spirochaetales bacterium]